MMHFFRRFRQGLISHNRIRKYLIYAIGEILLVVIGILIALSINNWNEQQKLNQREQLSLKQLKSELIVASNLTAGSRRGLFDQGKSVKSVLKNYWKDGKVNDSIISDLYYPLLRTSELSISFGFSKSMISSENIELIKSNRLKFHILSFVNSIENFSDKRDRTLVQLNNTINKIYEIYNPQMLSIQEDMINNEFYRDDKSGSKWVHLNLISQNFPGRFDIEKNPSLYKNVPYFKSLDAIFENEKLYNLYYQLSLLYYVLSSDLIFLNSQIDDLIMHIRAVQDGDSEELWDLPAEPIKAAIISDDND